MLRKGPLEIKLPSGPQDQGNAAIGGVPSLKMPIKIMSPEHSRDRPSIMAELFGKSSMTTGRDKAVAGTSLM